MRKRVISILGGNSNVSNHALELSEALGTAIVDNGWLLCTGGRSGVMEAASKGARKSEKWNGTQIIGVLPDDEHENGNDYLDIVLPSGLGLSRNVLVVRFSDACIAISGGAGTLSEIALAWQFNRPVAVMEGTGGWAEQLSNKALDHRKEEIPGLNDVQEAIHWITSVLNEVD